MKYTTQPDLDRKNAGWGDHSWIIEDGEPIRLLPTTEAKKEAERLNTLSRSKP